VTFCAKPLEELSAYLDGELGPEEERVFQRHLTACPSCQEKVKILAALEEAVMRSAETAPVPQLLHASVSALSHPSPWSFWGASRAVKTVLAGALILVVIGLASWWWQYGGERGKHEEIAQILVADHIHYLQVADALEIASADPVIIADWFRDRVPFPVQVPRFHDGRLLGGRLCSLLGQQASLVFYERGSKRLSLFTLPAEAVPLGERERIQAAHQDNPRCLSPFGQYALCFVGLEDVVLAIVAEEPEAKDLARSLFQVL
jgi:anti-sigma factor RsiW